MDCACASVRLQAGEEYGMAGFLFRLKAADGKPAEPSSLRTHR
jgi:hypothetical protein